MAASADEVKSILAALEKDKLARAAVALAAPAGVRPGEVLGFRWEDWSREDEQLSVVRAVWHGNVDSTKTDTERFVTVTPELRTILLDLWNEQGSPIAGFIVDRVGSGKRKNLLENLSKRKIASVLKKKGIPWHGFYSLRRFHGMAVRKESGSSDTMSKALGNSKEVADKHYLKPRWSPARCSESSQRDFSRVGLNHVQQMFNGRKMKNAANSFRKNGGDDGTRTPRPLP